MALLSSFAPLQIIALRVHWAVSKMQCAVCSMHHSGVQSAVAVFSVQCSLRDALVSVHQVVFELQCMIALCSVH